jgi:hypothetical protein
MLSKGLIDSASLRGAPLRSWLREMVVGESVVYHPLNMLSIMGKYPFPHTEYFYQLNAANIFSEIDLKSGYIKFVCGNKIVRRLSSPLSMGFMNIKLCLLD